MQALPVLSTFPDPLSRSDAAREKAGEKKGIAVACWRKGRFFVDQVEGMNASYYRDSLSSKDT